MKKSLDLSRGAIVEAHGRRYRITNDALGFKEVQALDLTTGRREVLALDDLRPAADVALPDAGNTASQSDPVPDLAVMDEERFAEAIERKRAIDAFLALPRRTRVDAERCAAELSMSVPTFYRWVKAYQSDDRTSTLAPIKRDGGRGKSRLKPEIESLIELAIKQHHNTPRKRRVSATYRYLKQLCRRDNVKPVHETRTSPLDCV